MWNTAIVDNEILYAGVFTANFSYLLAIVIGLTATYFVFKVARKMGGGLFGRVLNYVGMGMGLIVLGTISIALESSISPLWVELTHTIFFSLGFVFLAIGADKLFKGITSS